MANLYADRVFSEHPIGLWPLDSGIGFEPIFKQLPNQSWGSAAIKRYSAFVSDKVPTSPLGSEVARVVGTPEEVDDVLSVGESALALQITGPQISHLSLTDYRDSVDVGYYVYTTSPALYVATALHDDSGGWVTGIPPLVKRTTAGGWNRIEARFPKPDEEFHVVISLVFADISGEAAFYISPVVVGQPQSSVFGEEHVEVIDVPELSPFGVERASKIREYGFGRDYAYLAYYDDAPSAEKYGIPLEFGTERATHISSQNPAIIVPGKGFMHRNGQHKPLTLEFWTRIVTDGETDMRIAGPINNSDGLWIRGNSLALEVGGVESRHEIKRPFKPMLVHIVAYSGGVRLLVDGIDVASVNHSSLYPDSQLWNTDWISFSGTMEIGCISIYPYEVPPIVAKRRYVWGQGVQSQPSEDFAVFGKEYAKYSKSVDVDLRQGSFDNVEYRNGVLSQVDRTIPGVYTTRIPLSALSKVGLDAGGRQVSSFDFIEFHADTSSKSVLFFIGFRYVRSLATPEYEVITSNEFVMKHGLKAAVGNKAVIYPPVNDWPHLYEIELSVVLEGDSVGSLYFVSKTPSDNYQEIGNQGSMIAYPDSRSGNYWLKRTLAAYDIGQSGADLYLSDDSGITTVGEGSILLRGKTPGVVLGAQIWARNNGSGEISLSIGKQLVTLEFDEEQVLVSSNLVQSHTLFRDGYEVLSLVAPVGTWTSIGISFNPPVETGGSKPEIYLKGVTVNRVHLYGGESLESALNFRSWAQVLFDPNIDTQGLLWGYWSGLYGDEDWPGGYTPPPPTALEGATWQDVLVYAGGSTAMDVGKRYQGQIGSNRIIVDDDFIDHGNSIAVLDDGISITSRTIHAITKYEDPHYEEEVTGDIAVLSTPSWKTVGTYAG